MSHCWGLSHTFFNPPPPPPPHPSCKSVNMACSGKHIHSIHIHPVTLGSVPEITPTHQGCSPHMSHSWGLSHTFFNPPPPPYPSCKSVNMACSGKHIHSIHIHSVTLDSVPEITPTHQGSSPHISH